MLGRRGSCDRIPRPVLPPRAILRFIPNAFATLEGLTPSHLHPNYTPWPVFQDGRFRSSDWLGKPNWPATFSIFEAKPPASCRSHSYYRFHSRYLAKRRWVCAVHPHLHRTNPLSVTSNPVAAPRSGATEAQSNSPEWLNPIRQQVWFTPK